MKTLTSRSLLLIATAATLAFGGTLWIKPASAGTASANLDVSATVSDNCTISTTALTFVDYDPISVNASSPLDGSGGVSVTCTSGANATITLDQGNYADTGSTNAAPLRRLNNGSAYLSYDLYQDSGHSTVWGNTAGTGVSHTGTGTSTAITIYGRIPADQNVPAGNYSDTVVATVTF